MAVRQPVLIMIQGPEPGTICKLPDNRVTTIGRSSRNTVRAVNPSVSRFHCEVAWVNGCWELKDLNSKKGTAVNGKRLAGKWVLKPGDIIRISNIIFRFDMIEETAVQDGAMVAIKEAELEQKVRTRGEASGSLEDIRLRSRLEAGSAREARLRRSRMVRRADLAFLAVTAAAVGIVVTALLVYAHGKAASGAEDARSEQRARQLYAESSAASEDGRYAEALRKVGELLSRFPQSQEAREAEKMRAELLWSAAQEKLVLVSQLEGRGDYAAALALYGELEGLRPDRHLEGLLAGRREQTVRLARASFKAIEEAAGRSAEAGDVEGAVALYRRAGERIGLPDLVGRARTRIAELEEGTLE